MSYKSERGEKRLGLDAETMRKHGSTWIGEKERRCGVQIQPYNNPALDM
jgi:hypothetical protein